MLKIFIIYEKYLKNNRDQYSRYLIDANRKDVELISYQELKKNNKIIATEVPVFLCFPFKEWGKKIEKPNLIVGSYQVGNNIKKYVKELRKLMDKKFPKAHFVNAPETILSVGDKAIAKKIAKKNKIDTPQEEKKIIADILDVVSTGQSIYIKPRWGQMGKGITFISPHVWTTNFTIKGKEIQNHHSQRFWPNNNITNNITILKRILQEDVIVEHAIKNPQSKKSNFDIRIWSVYGETKPNWSMIRIAKNSPITNLVQGGDSFLHNKGYSLIPKKSIYKALKFASLITKAMKINNAGCDFLFQGNNFDPVFLEINNFPGIHERRQKQIITSIIKNTKKIQTNSC